MILLTQFEHKYRPPAQPGAPAQPQPPPAPTGPWFTGPLLTPSGHVIPVGYINVEPYLFVNVNTGVYNRHWHAIKTPKFYNINFQLPIQIGVTKWMDVAIVPQASYNRTKHAHDSVINDLPTNLDFQIIADTAENRRPGIKFYIQEIWPIGKYQKLSPHKLGTDIGGSGSFITNVGFVITRTYHLNCEHYLALRFNTYYSIPSSVHVRGLNAYGGAHDTHGTVHPGRSWNVLFGLEYSMTQNWALAFDAYTYWKDKTRFNGHSSAPVGGPSSVQVSLAPAIEYNWSSSLGIIAGSWFSIAGRNSPRFASGVIALNYFGPLRKQKCGPSSSSSDSYDSGGGGGTP